MESQSPYRVEIRSIGGAPGGVGGLHSEAVCLSGTLTHTRLSFLNFLEIFFNFLSAKEEELSHKSHTCVKNNTHVFYSTHMPVQKRTLSTTTKRSVLIYTRRRFTNPVMLTQQYMTRVHKEIENCGRVRWTYAWLGVSGALDE